MQTTFTLATNKRLGKDTNRQMPYTFTLGLVPLIFGGCGSGDNSTPDTEVFVINGSTENDLIGPYDFAIRYNAVAGRDKITASPFDDIILLENSISSVNALAGDDTVHTETWGNSINGGAGIDILSVNFSGSFNIVVDFENHVMYRENLLSSFNNEIVGMEGIDASNSISAISVISSATTQTISTGKGNDNVGVGANITSVNLGDGDDTVTVNSLEADLTGGNGSDTLKIIAEYGTGDVTINLNEETHSLNGTLNTRKLKAFENIDIAGSGNFTLIGSDNDNSLSASIGNDQLIGGKGNNILTGGAGRDIFVFSSTDNLSDANIITDFETGTQGDVLRFENYDGLTSTGLSFRSVNLSEDVSISLTQNSDILLISGSNFLNEQNLLSALNGDKGISEQRGASLNSIQLCIWYNQTKDGLQISTVKDIPNTNLFADQLNTLILLDGLTDNDFGALNAANFQII